MLKFIIGWYLLNFLVFGIFLIFKITERLKEKKILNKQVIVKEHRTFGVLFFFNELFLNSRVLLVKEGERVG